MMLTLSVAFVLALVTFDVMAQDKGPFDASQLVAYTWVVAVAMAGGLANFYRKVKSGQARWVNFNELLGELLTSGLVGMLTFWLCKWGGVNDYLTAAMVGISGHMGSRALFLMERGFERRMERWFPNGTSAPIARPDVQPVRGAPGDER